MSSTTGSDIKSELVGVIK